MNVELNREVTAGRPSRRTIRRPTGTGRPASAGRRVTRRVRDDALSDGSVDELLEVDADVIDIVETLKDRQAEETDQADIDVRFASVYFPKIDGRSTPLIRTLALDIMKIAPLAIGIDDRTWSYSGGVWKPDKNVIRKRATRLLQERYKPDLANAAGDIIRAELEDNGRKIDGSPVGKIINFKNGFLDWKTGELRPHDPDLLSTVQLNTEWNPDATCPEFDKFLASILPEDMIDIAWELIGYLMYSGNPLHKAVMFTGTGRNGKGTLMRVIQNLLGRENTTARSLHALANERFATADLFNKLANLAGDVDGTYMAETARFKGITGQDTMTAEYKGTNSFEFTPWAVPVFSANKVPGSADTTPGFMLRWVVINFPNSFAGSEDRGLDDRLGTPNEIEGIAAKAVPALRRVMKRGNFAESDSSRAAKAHFNRQIDQVRTWLHECAEIGEGFPPINRTALYNQYKEWVKENGVGQLKSTEFYDRMVSIDGITAKKIGGTRYLAGFKLLPRDDNDHGW
ncbi:DNA primase family protein [Streptosporangium canum]|uniref:DNA primase family protein n=1 Tax=Streptosporangium canum TaxID=324952 RepID=UPI0033AFE765